MKKKFKIFISIIIFSLIIIVSSNVKATEDITKKLYQDITINNDGSITVKEMALLSGDYNGRSREIKFKNYNANTFTGIYSNFTGNTDIYDGTSIKDIKIYDISQDNFNNIDDINKIEKIYKEVDSAKNGKYGVYTLYKNSYEAEFKIYCPAKKKKVFCMEYTITDAVVVHNDVAELYWNVIGDNYREDIEDFQVLVHLPKEDSDLRVWTHGPLTGQNSIINNKTVYFKDINVEKYEPETIRIMFNKDIVHNATKESNVNGREYILKYEQTMADEANATRYNDKLELINNANEAVIKLEKNKTMFFYNNALKYVLELEETEEKEQFLERINNLKEEVNQNWKKDIQKEIDRMLEDDCKYLTKYQLGRLERNIEEGFDENQKENFRKYLPIFNNVFEKRDEATRIVCTTLETIFYSLILVFVIYKLIKIISEKHKYKGKYYREFPSDDEPYVLEYLMKKKITNLSFSATILSLISKKVINVEKNVENEKDIQLTLIDDNYIGTEAEMDVLTILFGLVGNNNICYLEELKQYGKKESNAIRLTGMIKKFKKHAKKEAEITEYFKSNVITILLKVIVVINYIVTLIMSAGVLKGNQDLKYNFIYIGIITLISLVYYIIINKDKDRTYIGQLEYSKWMAHKRFLKDFSNFDEKDLPEITLWEKYLVTATILGCADKVEDKIKLYINNYDTSANHLLVATAINNNLIKTINNSINSSVSTANHTISSSSSSGGGFGGGSSGGGGGRWPEEEAEDASKRKTNYNKNKKTEDFKFVNLPFHLFLLIHMLLYITLLIFFL